MSITFSDTTNKNGIIQKIEKTLKFRDGFISGSPTRLKQFTADVNNALDRVLTIIFETGGRWQFDDSNHADYPIITTYIEEGQRDYAFTADSSGNLILDIHKVMIADRDGLFREIYPIDGSTRGGSPSNLDDGLNTSGLPTTYDKLGNALFLDPVPDYSIADGIKVYISREGSYFSPDDTSKKAGFAGLFHSYLWLRPCYEYAFSNGLVNQNTLKGEMLEMENAIREHYKAREKDDPKKITPARNNSR
jgi:hypothetical protein